MTSSTSSIDLNHISSNFELPINNIFNNSNKIRNLLNKFSYEEVEENDSSASIYYSQYNNKVLISIYGPRETRFRDKIKNEEANVEVYVKFNYEINKEKLRKINGIIQNFCESLIFLDAYPRCQINVCL